MTTHSNKALVIGAGFAGLSAASFLAKKGWSVTVVEKMKCPAVAQENLKRRDLHLIWDLVGIGCQMYLKNILVPLEKSFRFLSITKIRSFLSCLF